MKKKCQCLSRQVTICLLLGLFVVPSSLAVRPSRRDNTDREARTKKEDPRKEKMRQEATQSFPAMSDALTEILKKVAKNQLPQSTMIEQARQFLDDNKRNGWAYDEKQKAEFMLLQAWTGFYKDNPVDAVNWSRKACKMYAASQDAWASQILFSVLYDKRPMKPRKERSRSAASRRSPRRNVDETESRAKPKSFSEKGELEFDLDGFRDQFFRQQFGRLEFQAADGSTTEFVPGRDMLCVLFWQGDEKVADANGISDRPDYEPDPTAYLGEGMGMEQGTSYDTSKTSLQAQRGYIERLKSACKENSEIKFLQVVTNKYELAEEAAEKIAADSDVEAAGPLVFAADPDSKAQRFAGWDAKIPFMLILDKGGKVKYAGTAADFMPAFILTTLTGVEIDLAKQKTPASDQMEMGLEFDQMMMEMQMLEGQTMRSASKQLRDPNEPIADPNKPVADPNLPAKASGQSPGLVTLSLEDQVRAEKLLQSAEMHIENSRKLTMDNPRQGIEDARKVIEKYPNTKEAEKARYLLSRVPPSWKKKHKITEEETSVKKESE